MSTKNIKKNKDLLKDKIESVGPNIVFFVILPLLTAQLAFIVFNGRFNKNEKQDNNQVYKDTMFIEKLRQDSIIKYHNENQR